MSFLKSIYWKFYPVITNKVVYLQTQLCGYSLTPEIVLSKYGLTIKIIDYDSDDDLRTWCDIINNSYDDCFYDISKARSFFQNHLIFTNTKTVIFYKNTIPCASVSWGGVRNRSNIGGDFRIGVKNEFKGNGIGRMCVEFAYSRLSDEGYKFAESIITSKRVPSIMLHFSLGLKPRFNMNYTAFNSNLKNINFIQRIRLTLLLYKYYRLYKVRLKKSFK